MHLSCFRFSFLLIILSFVACRQMPTSTPEVGHAMEMAVAEEVQIPSGAMEKSFGAYVLLPSVYQADSTRHFPVVYLLHGYSGAYGDWYKKMPVLLDYADQHELIIVTPDGNFGSWYLDSPMDEGWKFETYVGVEIPEWVDAHYRTVDKPEGRGHHRPEHGWTRGIVPGL